jgi:pilus assembly protein CpaE
MAMTTENIKILLVSKNQRIAESTQAVLVKEKDLNLVLRRLSQTNLFSIINEERPEVILLDFDFQDRPFDLLDELTSRYPWIAVVAILSESKMENLERVILSGARAFIQYPYQDVKLVITIRRVVQLIERNQPPAQLEQPAEEEELRPNHTITVFSPKGGVGTTTIATNLAISMHNALNEDVLLIDGKQLFGHVPLYLNLLTGNSISDLITHAGMLDEQLIQQVAIRHSSGIRVLPSPNSAAESQGIRPESLYSVIQGLQKVFPNIIIDGGNVLNDISVTYMDSSEKILLVLSPDLAAMRDIRQFIDISATLSYPSEKLLFVLNMVGRKSDIRKDEIEHTLKIKFFGEVPADEDMALSSLNEGIPIVMKKNRHPISKGIGHIAKRLVKVLQAPLKD